MASQKRKLQQAAIKFHKENPAIYITCCVLLSQMARFIIESGITEVIAGIKNKEFYTNAKY